MQDRDRPQLEEEAGEYVLIRFPVADEPSVAAEGLWGRRVSSDRFVISNIPGWATGISLGDVVRARKLEGQLVVRDVVERGGHSTYRLARQNEGGAAFTSAWERLARLGCHYERLGPKMFAVDVPPAVRVGAVYEELLAAMNEGVWWFDELHVGHELDRLPE